MRILLGIPDLIASRVRVRLLLLERAQEIEREREQALGHARKLDADEVGHRADERTAARSGVGQDR